MFKTNKYRYLIYSAAALLILITGAVICKFIHTKSPVVNVHRLLRQNDTQNFKWPSDSLHSPSLLEIYYRDSMLSYLWTGAGKNEHDNRTMLIQMLRYIDSIGLQAKDYHAAYIVTYDSLARINQFNDRERTAETELVFTDAALTMLFDISYGKPISLTYTGIKYKVDTAGIATIFRQLLINHEWRNTFINLEPNRSEYNVLKTAYNRLRSFNNRLPDADSIDTSGSAPAKRNIILKLKAYGLIDETINVDSVTADEMRYAVGDFQKMTGIGITGTLNQNTIDVLKVPLVKRMAEIRRSLNFWRWCNRLVEQKFILVNIAGAQLWLMDDSSAVSGMRIVAGEGAQLRFMQHTSAR